MAKSKPNKMWLKDFLPDTVPDARIMTYGYDARFLGSSRDSQSLYDHAKTLLARLSLYRRFTEVRRFHIHRHIHAKDKGNTNNPRVNRQSVAQ